MKEEIVRKEEGFGKDKMEDRKRHARRREWWIGNKYTEEEALIGKDRMLDSGDEGRDGREWRGGKRIT